MKKSLVLIFFALFMSSAAYSTDTVGTILWVDGVVDVFRNGEIMDWWDVDIGLEIEDYDMIETGSDGYVEIEVLTPGNSGTIVKVSEDTAFYFDVEDIGNGQRTTFEMLSGSLSLKVGKLAGNNQLEVRTESAVMGVRGTDFTVKLAPEQSVLVTCSEGRVEVAEEGSGSGKANAEPGAIVQKPYDSGVKPYHISVEDLDLYESFWFSQREEIFKSGAKSFIRYYSSQYASVLPKFLLAYQNLSAVRDTLLKYGTMEGGSTGTMIEAKQAVSGPIFEMRSIFPIFQHIFYAVQTLEKYHDQGYGMGLINENLSSTTFFSSFTSGKKSLKQQMADVRYYFKLFLNIDAASSGGFGSNEIMNDIFNGSNPMDGGSSIPQGNIPGGFDGF